MRKSANLFNSFLESFTSFLYPPLCMHCEKILESNHKIFCKSCFLDIELLSLNEARCFNCFFPVDGPYQTCNTCKTAIFTALLAVFPLMGAVSTFYAKLKTLYGSYLCKTASAFMAVQLFKANWPLPDLIVPIPQTLNEKLFRSHHYNASIARELAMLLNRPVANPFRFSFKKMNFSEIQPHAIKNKNILLVGDLLNQQGQIHEYAEILAQEYPKNLYGIALCQTV